MQMSEIQQEYYALKGMVASLPKEQQDTINACKQELNAILERYGDEGLIAFALVGIERQQG